MRLRKLIIAIPLILIMLGVFSYVHADNYDSEINPLTRTTPLNTETLEALTNRQTHPFSTEKANSSFKVDGFKRVAETDRAELWLNEEWNTIRIRNKASDYVWGALALESAEGLNKTWNNYGNSIAAIECYDDTGNDKRYSMTSDANVRYQLIEDGILCAADFYELGIEFDVKVTLEDNRLSLAVDEESIKEGKDGKAYRLKSLTFLPYLGAVYSDSVNGYMLIPDGPGALIRFKKPSQYSSTYAARVYGKDLGIESLSSPSELRTFRPNDYIVEEPQILMPIYGVVHGTYQDGLFAVIDNGAEYASIIATPALKNNPYNRISANFEFRQKYNKNINRKEGAGAVVPQEHRNEISPELSVYLLDGKSAHYDGMAVFYRNHLVNNKILEASLSQDISLPMKIEVLGADYHDEFLGKSLRVFTDTKEAAEIAYRLEKEGITNLSLIYKCYTKNNEAGRPLLKRVGGKEELQRLSEQIIESGGRFYLYLNPLSANKDQITQRTEAANNLSNMAIKLSRNNSLLMYPETYFYRLSEAEERITKSLVRIDDTSASGIALDQLSYRLFGDFTSGREKTRAMNLEHILNLVDQITTTMGANQPMYRPNQYLWKDTSEFYDVPLSGAQYLYETDTVPFLQIVLNKNMQLFSSPLNTGTYSRERILRLIEYGVAPSFVVTASDSIDLYKTAQEDYFSTNFDDWESFIHDAYNTVSDALAPVTGQYIMKHEVLEEGFIRITYENNAEVYVNYTGTEKSHGDVKVEPRWYYVNK